MRGVDTLARLIAPSSNTLRLRTARVSAFTSTRLTVTLAGSTLTIPYLSTYAPANGDTVLVLQTNTGVLVALGRTA